MLETKTTLSPNLHCLQLWIPSHLFRNSTSLRIVPPQASGTDMDGMVAARDAGRGCVGLLLSPALCSSSRDCVDVLSAASCWLVLAAASPGGRWRAKVTC